MQKQCHIHSEHKNPAKQADRLQIGRNYTGIKEIIGTQGHHSQKQRKENILIAEFQYFPPYGQIKRDFGDQGKTAQPQSILYFVLGMPDSFDQKEAEYRKAQPPNQPHRPIQNQYAHIFRLPGCICCRICVQHDP